MGFWEKFRIRLQLGSLYGRDQKLHNAIAGGYARGKYLADARREQRKVRESIRALEERLSRG